MQLRKWGRVIALTLAFVHMAVLFPMEVQAKDYANLTDLGLTAKSAILMDAATGSVVYEQNPDEALPPASVTKIMTLLLIYEAEADGKFQWTDMVSVSEHAAGMGGSQVYLEPFEQQTAKDMTKCVAIASANDAAVAMAEFVAGSEEGFVQQMNERAKELGMNNTHFVNACGLDAEGHLTTARDIAIMSRELITKHPEVTEYTTTWMDSIIHKTKRGESEFGLTNTNKLIQWYEGTTGLKTGSTGNALYCLSGTAEKNGLHLIGVVMAAPDPKVRFQEVMKLLDYGFANYASAQGLPAGETVGVLPVQKGMARTVDAVVETDVSAFVPKDQVSAIEKEVVLLPELSAPFEAGAKVGNVVYSVNGEEVARADVVTAAGVDKINFWEMAQRMLDVWIAK